jgi:hypothetical protein
MSNTQTTHEAAGATATTARGEVKEKWYKNPTALHIIIAAAVIAVALIINATFPFNLFWKLLVGGALVWGGGKLAATKISAVSLWGKILSGLGWVIIVLALLQSGARHFAEGAVSWTDNFLGSVWSEGKTGGRKPQVVDIDKLGAPGSWQEETLGVLDTLSVYIPPARAREGANTVCAEVSAPMVVATRPDLPKWQIEFFSQTGQNQQRYSLRLTKELREFLVGLNEGTVTIKVTLVRSRHGAPNPCQHTR